MPPGDDGDWDATGAATVAMAVRPTAPAPPIARSALAAPRAALAPVAMVLRVTLTPLVPVICASLSPAVPKAMAWGERGVFLRCVVAMDGLLAHIDLRDARKLAVRGTLAWQVSRLFAGAVFLSQHTDKFEEVVMSIATMNSRTFARDAAAVKLRAQQGPVIIAERGKPLSGGAQD